MIGEENGRPRRYKASLPAAVRSEMKVLHRRAVESGLGDSFRAALQRAYVRLRKAPLDFGEFVGRKPSLGLVVHVGTVRPLRFHFAINESEGFVVILKVELVNP